MSLEDIAEACNLDFGELLTEMETIVYGGMKLNIDYYLDEIMDEDELMDIYEYFEEAESDDLDEALAELGSDYTEDEIRLVRIKFISEMAN
jgi:ATP-dependent DNA helicase RecQ